MSTGGRTMFINRNRIAAAIVSAVLSGGLLIAQEARTPITRDEVWQAIAGELRQRGVSDEQRLGADEIEIPAMVPAMESRVLRVSMVCWDAELQRAQFQMECSKAGQCVPFLAYGAVARSTTMGGARKFIGSSCRSVNRPASEIQGPLHKMLVRVGERATVFFRGNALNMTALVTCLERGAEGDLIRVRNQDGQIFRARVFGPARLEAIAQ